MNKIPQDLKKIIGSDKIDFIIKSKRDIPLKKAFQQLLFSFFWNGFISLFVFAFILPIFQNYNSDDSLKFDSIFDLSELIPPLIISLFVLIGIYLFIDSMIKIFKKGSYFAGTENGLIQFKKGKTKITNWNQFTGNIKIDSKNGNGNLEFELKTGKMESRDESPDEFVPDIIYIASIDNVYEIERKCRNRIQKIKQLQQQFL